MMPARVTRITCVYCPPVTLKCSGRDQTPSDSGTHSLSSRGQTSGITRSGRMSGGCEPRYGSAAVSRLVTSDADMVRGYAVRGEGARGPDDPSPGRHLGVHDFARDRLDGLASAEGPGVMSFVAWERPSGTCLKIG